MTVELLIEDYKRRLKTIKEEITKNPGKMKCSRLEAKASCYRTFISELERIDEIKEELG